MNQGLKKSYGWYCWCWRYSLYRSIFEGTSLCGPPPGCDCKGPAGNRKGQIDPSGPAGYLGIPGGLQINLIVAFIWAVWVGWVFSTVGAFGGILAGVGHISVFGLGDYAKSFKDTSPGLNKFITDSVRVSNQWLVGLSALVSSVNYGRQKRLGIALGVYHGRRITGGRLSGGLYHHGEGQILGIPGLFRPDRFYHRRVHGLRYVPEGPGIEKGGQGRGQGL